MGWDGSWGGAWAGAWGGADGEAPAPASSTPFPTSGVTWSDVGDDPIEFEEG